MGMIITASISKGSQRIKSVSMEACTLNKVRSLQVLAVSSYLILNIYMPYSLGGCFPNPLSKAYWWTEIRALPFDHLHTQRGDVT